MGGLSLPNGDWGLGFGGIRFRNAADTGWDAQIYEANNNWLYIRGGSGGGIIFRNSGGGDIVRFADSGKVGIGTMDPQAKLHVNGNVELAGPLSRIHDRPLVGVASNGYDDLIFNFNGAVYWFKGTQGGGSQGGGSQKMRLDPDGSLWLGATPRKAIDANGYCLYG